MKTSMSALFSLAVVLPAAKANFDLYWSFGGGVGGSSSSWQLFNAVPNCDQAGDVPSWESKTDVSGDKWGIRCSGDCTDGEIDEMEMHFNDDLHWTIYRESDFELTTPDGEVQGNCFMYTGDEYSCNVGPIGIVEGRRRMRCLTASHDADSINDVWQPS